MPGLVNSANGLPALSAANDSVSSYSFDDEEHIAPLLQPRKAEPPGELTLCLAQNEKRPGLRPGRRIRSL